MLKKVFAFIIVQFYFFSVFGVNFHQCLCCGENDGVIEMCSSDTHATSLQMKHNQQALHSNQACEVCTDFPPSSKNVQGHENGCGCDMDDSSDNCDGTSIILTSEIYTKNAPQFLDGHPKTSHQANIHPVLISLFFFKVYHEFSNPDSNQKFESSIFKIYQQTPLFDEFCVYRT